jgi:hypothetical protein
MKNLIEMGHYWESAKNHILLLNLVNTSRYENTVEFQHHMAFNDANEICRKIKLNLK